MANNIWPPNCEHCRSTEQDGGRSYRQAYSQRVAESGFDQSTNQLYQLSLFIGNKCNLHCLTCDAKYSTGWIKIATEFDVDHAPHVGFDTMKLDSIWHRLQDLRELHIMGGEPMYQDDLLKIITYLSPLGLGQCRLMIVTNGVTKPSAELIAAWQEFKSVDITVSVDGVGAQFEYIRHPGQWTDLVENIEFLRSLPNVEPLKMNGTVSMTNCWDVEQLAHWGIQTFGLGCNFTAANKDTWDLANLPPALKQAWLVKYGQAKWARGLTGHMQSRSADTQAWLKWKTFISNWDNHWNLDFASTFPEWHDIIKRNQLW